LADSLRLHPAQALESAAVTQANTISLVSIDNQPAYRIVADGSPVSSSERHSHVGHATAASAAPAKQSILVSAVDGRLIAGGESTRVLDLARAVGLGEPRPDLVDIVNFGPEYGFAFKRLPVVQVTLEDGNSVFVDPADGAIAAVVGQADRIEDWVFGYIHKLVWLDDLVTSLGRDIISALLALAFGTSAVLGSVLYARRRAHINKGG
jgi:hypothetical protein